jgi:AraC-like DNA-binding protein/quercetin dioxygenase-like cupin family protein
MKREKQQISPSLPKRGVLIKTHTHGPRFQTAPHSHPHHSLLYIVAGQGRCIIGKSKKSFDLVPNTVLILKANQPHQMIDTPGKAMTVFVVYFNRPVANGNTKILSTLLKSPEPVLTPPHKAQRLRQTLRRMLHEQDQKPPQFAVAIQQCLSGILLELYRIAVGKNYKIPDPVHQNSKSRTAEVLEYIAEHFYEPQSLTGAAKMANLSQRQFTNMCRKITTRSFVQYVNQQRTQKAADLLKNTNVPVAAIAFEVGFEELSTFYRAFKRFHKTSPLAFRKSSMD